MCPGFLLRYSPHKNILSKPITALCQLHTFSYHKHLSLLEFKISLKGKF